MADSRIQYYIGHDPLAPTNVGSSYAMIENTQTIDSDYTLFADKNAVSAGPITIATGVTVTIQSGARWVIV